MGILGSHFGKAFLRRFNKRHGERQWDIKSDIQEHPERNSDATANGPFAGCELVASTWFVLAFAMSNVLRMMLCPLC